MKKQRHWLDFAEYASLVGLGVGSVASFVSSQVLYTSAPLSLLVLLNLANRRRFEQVTRQDAAIAVDDMDRKLSKHVELLNQQVLALPTPEAMGSLKKSLLIKNREVLEQLSSEISALQHQMISRLTNIEQQNLGAMRQEVSQIQAQYGQLCDSIADLTLQVNQLSSSTRVENLEGAIAKLRADTVQLRDNLQSLSDQTKPSLSSLQDQINQLNRQLQKLPPPFDSTALKQEVAELIRVVADLVPKRDWNNLITEVRTLHQQQESRIQAEEGLRQQIQELTQQLQTRPAKSNLTALQNQINHLNRQFQKLPPPFDSTSLKREIGELMKAVAGLVPKRDWNALLAQIKALQQQQEFQKQFEETLRHELDELSQQLQMLATAPQPNASAVAESRSLEEQLPQPDAAPLHPQQEFQARIETVLNQELRAIDRQLQALPSGPQLQAQIEETLSRELQDINDQLRAFPAAPRCELVFDFKTQPQGETKVSASQMLLEEALEATQERLILIWPWSSQCSLDDALMHKLEAFLSRGCRLDLGWCHLANRDEERFLSPINQRWSIHPMQQGLQTTLQKLLQLKRSYSEQFQFKILGTSENFLVSDQSFAALGIDDALTATTVFPDMELKLYTDDADVIQQCIERFDYPVLHANDIAAYWNRAVTRYDLGDRQGAIDDFDQLLVVDPHDAIAYNYRGLVHYDLGNLSAAIADFSRSLDINPRQTAGYCNRGFVRSQQGDQLGAIADYSLALQNHPKSAIAYFYRGMACQKYNDPLAAVTDFSEAIRLVPDSAISYYYRGQAYQKLENLWGAIADFEMAENLFTERGNTTNAQKALKSLTKARHLANQQGLLQPQILSPSPTESEPETLVSLLQHVDSVIENNGHAAKGTIADVSSHSQVEADFPSLQQAFSTVEPTSSAQPEVELPSATPDINGRTEETALKKTASEATPEQATAEESAPIDLKLSEESSAADSQAAIVPDNHPDPSPVPDAQPTDEQPQPTNGTMHSNGSTPPAPAKEPLSQNGDRQTKEANFASYTRQTPPVTEPNKADASGVDTLSTFFYGVGTEETIKNGSTLAPKAPKLPTILDSKAASPNFGDRPEAETLADFCKRFYG